MDLKNMNGIIFSVIIASAMIYSAPVSAEDAHKHGAKEKHAQSGPEHYNNKNWEKDWEEMSHLIHKVGDIIMTGGITGIWQGTNDANASPDGESSMLDFSYTFDLNLEAEVSRRGKIIAALEAGNGQGLNDNLNVISIVNYDPFITETATEANSFATLSISQAYYEGTYYDSRLVVSLGKLDVHSFTDDNAYANDETDQFIGAMFTRSQGSIFAELDAYYAPGLALQAAATDWLDLMLIISNGSGSGFEDVLDKGYLSAQATFKSTVEGYNGNYRLYWIGDNRDYTEIDNGENSANTGWGLSLDQDIWNGCFGLFARYSQQDDGLDENIVKSSYSLGMQAVPRFSKSDDVVGIAYGTLVINDASSASPADADDETHIELYYKFHFSDHFTLTPDVQFIQNPGGSASADDIFTYGFRTQFNF